MGREIERKFLVADEGWRDGEAGVWYRQGYLLRDPARTVRVRVAGERAYLTIKSARSGIERAEYEYEIPVEDAEEMLGLAEGPVIEKKRYLREWAGRTWEVDEFFGANEGLVVAEVEMETADAVIEHPPWLGEEVSEDPRYFNSALAVRPWREWGRCG